MQALLYFNTFLYLYYFIIAKLYKIGRRIGVGLVGCIATDKCCNQNQCMRSTHTQRGTAWHLECV